MNTVLKMENLTKRYGGLEALSDISLELPAGKIVGLLGPNASGKSTLLKLVAGLLTPTSGSIEVCGQKVGAVTKSMVSYLPDRTYFGDNRRLYYNT